MLDRCAINPETSGLGDLYSTPGSIRQFQALGYMEATISLCGFLQGSTLGRGSCKPPFDDYYTLTLEEFRLWAHCKCFCHDPRFVPLNQVNCIRDYLMDLLRDAEEKRRNYQKDFYSTLGLDGHLGE
jgi:hypothetical protein